MAKLFPISLFIATAPVYADLPPAGPNVCRFTYTKVERDPEVLGCLGFSWIVGNGCSRYRYRTAVGVEYRCCEGWHSTDSETCTQVTDVLFDTTTNPENTDSLLETITAQEKTDGQFDRTTVPAKTDGQFDRTSAPAKTDGQSACTIAPAKTDGLFHRTAVPAKTGYFAVVATKNFRMTAVPQFSVKAHTAMGCARKCHNHPNQCRMFNMNKRTRWCRGFSAQPPTGAPAEHWELWRLVPR